MSSSWFGAGSIWFSKRGGGEGTELAAETEVQWKVAGPVEFRGVRRRRAIRKGSSLERWHGQSTVVEMLALCCGIPFRRETETLV